MIWLSFIACIVCGLLVSSSHGFLSSRFGNIARIGRSYAKQLEMATPTEFKAQLMNDMKEAMKAKEKVRLTSVKAIQAAIKQKEVDEQKEITEEGCVAVMNKLVKQRKESILSYTEGNRPDLAVAEQAECDVIYSYLPKQLTTEEVGKMITEAIAKVAATNIKDMGKVMAELKPLLMGKADMTTVGNLIRQQLGGPVGKK